MKKANALPFVLTNQIETEMVCIDKSFRQEVDNWKNKYKIRLLILAEAPLSCDKYFYNRIRGNFLSGLNKYLNAGQKNLLVVLRQKGIFVLDMYKYPVKTEFYDEDSRTHNLFDSKWFCDRIKLLESEGLLDNYTRAVFRYKKLLSRYMDMVRKNIQIPCLQKINFLPDSQGNPACLNKVERPIQVLSVEVLKYFRSIGI